MNSIGVQYLIDLKDRITAPVRSITASVSRITNEVKQSNAVVLEASKKAEFAALKRRDLLRQEKQYLTELKIRRRSAFTVSEIDVYNKRIAETTSRIKTLNSATDRSNKIFAGLKSQLGMFAMGAVGIYQGIAFMKGTLREWDLAQQAEAAIRTTLESTKGVVGRSLNDIIGQAAVLQKKTVFADDDIMNAQAVLLTFTNIRKELFDKTTPAILDLATKMNIDLRSATLKVGRAMNDPINNLSALTRAGIQFSEDQKKNIKSLAETGQLAEAQMIILGELNRRFGGSAEAAAKAGMGPWKQLANLWGDARETLGGMIMGIVNNLLPTLRALVAGLQASFQWMKRNADTLKLVAKVVGIAVAAWAAYRIGAFLSAKYSSIVAARIATKGVVSQIATGKIIGLTASIKALSLATKLNPLGLLLGVAAAATLAIVSLTNRTKRLAAGQKEVNEVMAQTKRAYLEEQYRVHTLARVIQDASKPYEVRAEKLRQLKQLSHEHFGALKLEKEGVKGLDVALKDYLRTRQQEIFQKAAKEQQEKFLKEKFDYEAGLMDEQFKPGFWQKGWAYLKGAATKDYFMIEADLQRAQLKNERKFYNERSQAYSNFMARMRAMAKQYGFDLLTPVAGAETDLGADPFTPTMNFNENTIKGGEGIKNIHITIGKLVETISVKTNTMEQSPEEFGERVTQVFMQAVNDANYAQI